MGKLVLAGLFLLSVQLAGCTGTLSAATAISFTCNSGSRSGVTALPGKGSPVSPSALDAVFSRLDKQPRLEVRETNCGLSLVSLRYVKPNRMQLVAWLKGTARDPRETQVGNRLGYIGHRYSGRWIGVGVTAHRMLLPDAWRGVISGRHIAPTFYLLSPPRPPVRHLSVRVLDHGEQRLLIEQWRGVLYQCPAGVSCPAPNLDPRRYARFTAVLHVDRTTGLPVSLVTSA